MQTSEKTCFKCGETKPLSELYRHPKTHDGHLGKCKECAKNDVRKNRYLRIDYYRAYDRERGNRMSLEAQKRQRETHPEWVKAHNAVAKAKINGKLHKMPCEYCGSIKVHAHHDDYSKPLDVRWLCPLHHRMVHTSSQK